MGLRPWGLSWSRPARRCGEVLREAYRYDHSRQIAVDSNGTPLISAEPTVNEVSSDDGDEGPSEDYTYDYCPDSPAAI